MTIGYVARRSGPQHDSATRRLDEARVRQHRLVDCVAAAQSSAQERLSAGRAGVVSREQWLHWIDEAESLEPWADGDWAPTPTLAAGGCRAGPLAVSQHPGAIVELVHEPRGDGSPATAASWVGPALPACVGPLRQRLATFAAAHIGSAERLGDLRLAASEAITNAVIHAYRDRDQPGTVTAGIGVAAGRVEVIVADGGVGMSQRPDSPGAGLGLSLMAAVCDQVIIRPGPTGDGTEVRLIFALR